MSKPRESIIVQSDRIYSMDDTLEFKILEYPSKNELYRLYTKSCNCFFCVFFGDHFNHKPKPYWSHIDTSTDIEKLKMRVQAIKNAETIRKEKPVNEILL